MQDRILNVSDPCSYTACSLVSSVEPMHKESKAPSDGNKNFQVVASLTDGYYDAPQMVPIRVGDRWVLIPEHTVATEAVTLEWRRAKKLTEAEVNGFVSQIERDNRAAAVVQAGGGAAGGLGAAEEPAAHVVGAAAVARRMEERDKAQRNSARLAVHGDTCYGVVVQAADGSDLAFPLRVPVVFDKNTPVQVYNHHHAVVADLKAMADFMGMPDQSGCNSHIYYTTSKESKTLAPPYGKFPLRSEALHEQAYGTYLVNLEAAKVKHQAAIAGAKTEAEKRKKKLVLPSPVKGVSAPCCLPRGLDWRYDLIMPPLHCDLGRGNLLVVELWTDLKRLDKADPEAVAKQILLAETIQELTLQMHEQFEAVESIIDSSEVCPLLPALVAEAAPEAVAANTNADGAPPPPLPLPLPPPAPLDAPPPPPPPPADWTPLPLLELVETHRDRLAANAEAKEGQAKRVDDAVGKGPKATATGGKHETKRQKDARTDTARRAAEKLREEGAFLRQQAEDLEASYNDIRQIFAALRQAESEYDEAEGGEGADAEGGGKSELVSELKRIFHTLGISQQRYWNGTLVGNDLRTYFKNYLTILEAIGALADEVKSPHHHPR